MLSVFLEYIIQKANDYRRLNFSLTQTKRLNSQQTKEPSTISNNLTFLKARQVHSSGEVLLVGEDQHRNSLSLGQPVAFSIFTSFHFCLSTNLLIRCNSNLASSNLSLSLESTTKMIASVARVYDLQRGLVLSCPPMSQMLKIRPNPDFT